MQSIVRMCQPRFCCYKLISHRGAEKQMQKEQDWGQIALYLRRDATHLYPGGLTPLKISNVTTVSAIVAPVVRTVAYTEW